MTSKHCLISLEAAHCPLLTPQGSPPALPANTLPASLTASLLAAGGGFTAGHPLQWLPAMRQLLRALAQAGVDARIFAVEYCLAPEHPFPAAITHITHAYQWISQQAECEGAEMIIGRACLATTIII